MTKLEQRVRHLAMHHIYKYAVYSCRRQNDITIFIFDSTYEMSLVWRGYFTITYRYLLEVVAVARRQGCTGGELQRP